MESQDPAFNPEPPRGFGQDFFAMLRGDHNFLPAVFGLGCEATASWWDLPLTGSSDPGGASADSCNTLVESIPEGWFYTAGLADNRRVTGFMADRDLLPGQLHSCARRVYSDALARTQYSRERLQGAAWDGMVRIFAAGPTLVERVAGSSWLLVGDAASTVDPISSQGIQKAITSALAASVVVQTILSRPDQAGPAIEFYQDREETTYRFAR